MKGHKLSLKYFTSIILISLGIMLFSCENDLATVESLQIDESTPASSSYDVDMEYTDSGNVAMRIQSPEVNRFIGDEEYLEMPQGVHMIFYDTLGNVRSTLDADYAVNHIQEKTMHARNNVIATNSKGQQLFTEELIWDQAKHLIYTEKEVKVITDGKILFGDGLRANENFEDWEISNPHGDIEVEEEIENDSL